MRSQWVILLDFASVSNVLDLLQGFFVCLFVLLMSPIHIQITPMAPIRRSFLVSLASVGALSANQR